MTNDHQWSVGGVCLKCGRLIEEVFSEEGCDPPPSTHLRAAVLEEAAKVAETGDYYGQFQTAGDERRAKSIAERIRALASTEGQDNG